jgi:hypothetical protein
MVECIYKAKTRFKYNGKEIRRGDTWEPAGLKNDKLIERNLVRLERLPVIEQSIPPDLETAEPVSAEPVAVAAEATAENTPPAVPLPDKPRGKRERHDPAA